METYQEFKDRINSFAKKEIYLGDDFFSPNPSLSLKVRENGVYRDFYGDTVVFDLDCRTKEKLSETIQVLSKSSPECFCQALIPETLHMTLHDLHSSPYIGKIAEEIFFSGIKAAALLKGIKSQKIRMKTTYIFNMVNTSIVLGLFPTDEKEYRKLMDLYNCFDQIRPLPYPFTPHITLAYFNPNGFSKESAEVLKETVSLLNNSSLEIILDTERLYYQKFTDMNNYISITGLSASPEHL